MPRGGIYINDVWSRLENFEADLEEEMSIKGTSSVYLRGDSAVTYGIAISVIGRLKEMGIEEIGLVTATIEESSKKKK